MSRVLKIAWREYLSFLRTPGFWISLLVAPIGAALAGMAPGMMERSEPAPVIAVVDLTAGPGQRDASAPLYNAVRRALDKSRGDASGPRPEGRAAGVQLVEAPRDAWTARTPEAAGAVLRPYVAGDRMLPGVGRLDAAAVLHGPRDKPVVDFWTRNLADRGLEGAVVQPLTEHLKSERLKAEGIDPRLVAALDQLKPEVRDFSPKAENGRVSGRDRLPVLAGFGLAFMLWALILTGAGILLNSVIEEKANRVLEVLLSSADTHEILGGKILGVAALSGTVMTLWVVMGLTLLNRSAPGMAMALLEAVTSHGLLVWFALYFVAGYLMYASLFAAIGAFCETSREAQTLLGPVMILLTVPMVFLSVAVRRPDTPIIEALSWFPPFTPFLMTARAAAGLSWVELAGALALMVATAAAVVAFSARAFRAGALSTIKLDPRAGLLALLRAGRVRA